MKTSSPQPKRVEAFKLFSATLQLPWITISIYAPTANRVESENISRAKKACCIVLQKCNIVNCKDEMMLFAWKSLSLYFEERHHIRNRKYDAWGVIYYRWFDSMLLCRKACHLSSARIYRAAIMIDIFIDWMAGTVFAVLKSSYIEAYSQSLSISISPAFYRSRYVWALILCLAPAFHLSASIDESFEGRHEK